MSIEPGGQDPPPWNRLILGSAALGIAAIGAIYLFTPQTLLSIYGIDLRSASEANLYRSAYGGLFLAFALLFGLGAIGARHSRTALLALLTFMGGLAVGRLVSVVADGWPHPLLTAVLVVELAYAGAAGVVLKATSRPRL
jgi:hypothetical protein